MTKHKNILHLSETPSDPLPAPEGSSFGGLRQRVGRKSSLFSRQYHGLP